MQVAIIGTGNVAYHLAKRLRDAGHPPVIIAGRTKQKGERFIRSLNLQAAISLDFDLRETALDFVLLAVPDKEIKNVVSDYEFYEKAIVLHASGAQEMELLKDASKAYGVLYPFQTFTKEKPVAFDQIPIFIEGNSEETETKIEKFARFFGPKVYRINSEQRLKAHLAAVFASNFTNNLFTIAASILRGSKLDLPDLEHLILETVEKAMVMSPEVAQTGPAKRNDTEVLNKHLQVLENEDLQQLYKLHTDLIQKRIIQHE